MNSITELLLTMLISIWCVVGLVLAAALGAYIGRSRR